METASVLAIVANVLGFGLCAIFVRSTTSGQWVSRRELHTRAELHDRDYRVLTGERNGWRDVGLDIKGKLERAATVILELKAAIIVAKDQHVSIVNELMKAKEENALLVAEIAKLRNNNGTARPEAAEVPTTQRGQT